MPPKSSIFVVVLLSAPPGAPIAAAQEQDRQASRPLEVGADQFRSPETALWDDRQDVYLVSNVHGRLTAIDDNGFISRVLPSGEIADLKWIDGGKPHVALNGPKGMILTEDYLVVADVHTLRFFDRTTGDPVRAVPAPHAYMLNDPARAPDGTLFVTDTGGATSEHPGAVYELTDAGDLITIAQGIDYDRPDGLVADEQGLLVAPFEAHARDLYRLSRKGVKTAFATLPQPKLDGLLALPDGSFIVTSWAGKAVYRLKDGNVEIVVGGLGSPAQVGYDGKRERLLVPQLEETSCFSSLCERNQL